MPHFFSYAVPLSPICHKLLNLKRSKYTNWMTRHTLNAIHECAWNSDHSLSIGKFYWRTVAYVQWWLNWTAPIHPQKPRPPFHSPLDSSFYTLFNTIISILFAAGAFSIVRITCYENFTTNIQNSRRARPADKLFMLSETYNYYCTGLLYTRTPLWRCHPIIKKVFFVYYDDIIK